MNTAAEEPGEGPAEYLFNIKNKKIVVEAIQQATTRTPMTCTERGIEEHTSAKKNMKRTRRVNDAAAAAHAHAAAHATR